MGECNQETTESILDFYYENGGMMGNSYGLFPEADSVVLGDV